MVCLKGRLKIGDAVFLDEGQIYGVKDVYKEDNESQSLFDKKVVASPFCLIAEIKRT